MDWIKRDNSSSQSYNGHVANYKVRTTNLTDWEVAVNYLNGILIIFDIVCYRIQQTIISIWLRTIVCWNISKTTIQKINKNALWSAKTM